MRNLKTIVTGIVVLILSMNNPLSAQRQSNSATNTRFQAELSEYDKNNGFILDVTYYGTKPTIDKTEQSLRYLLNAASVMYPDSDITAKAWHSASAETNDRTAIVLSNGLESLDYKATDKVVLSNSNTNTTTNDIATLLLDSKIIKNCKNFSQEQVTILANTAIEKRGEERKYILKAMRDWCGANEVELSRKMRVCMSSISKAVVALPSANNETPVDLPEAIARGEESYSGDNNCVNCHQRGGRGGPKGPDLTDDEWLHCDGSIEGIKKVILSGVPLDKLKDSSRTWQMSAYKNLKTDKKQLNDLAIYVHSLSQN